MDDRNLYAILGFLNESFTLNDKYEKTSLPTAAFQEDTNMFSSEFTESFGL